MTEDAAPYVGKDDPPLPPAPPSMVDRVAMAIAQTASGRVWSALPWQERVMARAVARAAIEAMRAPTPGILHAMAVCLDYPGIHMGGPSQQARRKAARVYEAAIDAAREG